MGRRDGGGGPGTLADMGLDDQFGPDPEAEMLYQALSSNSANDEKRENLKHQIMLANMLRQGPEMPEGHQTRGDHGGVYVAPNALQIGGSVMNHILGLHQMQDVSNKADQLAQGSQDARTRMLAALIKAHSQPGPSGGIQMPPQGGSPPPMQPPGGQQLPGPVGGQPFDPSQFHMGMIPQG